MSSDGSTYRIDYYPGKWVFNKVLGNTKAVFAFCVFINELPFSTIDFISENEWYAQSVYNIYHFNKGRLVDSTSNSSGFVVENANQYFLKNIAQNITGITPKNNLSNTTSYIASAEKIMSVLYDSLQHNYYIGSFNKPFRVFPYLKKYPAIFNGLSASNIHAIAQDNKNRIWVASYDGNLSILNNDKATTQRQSGLGFMPGAISFGCCQYLIGENNIYGLLQYDGDGNKKSLTKNVTGFYQYISADNKRYYFGTNANHGLWTTDVNFLNAGNPNWKIIDSSKGNYLQNIVSITEDKKGRVWMGQGGKGWAVYYPQKDKAITRLITKNETNFGVMSSVLDDEGTVWMGTGQRALLYYTDYSCDTILSSQIKKIQHPLLPDGLKIRQLKIWKNWLLIGAEDKMLLLNLSEWHNNNKVILRYLNPQETGFTASLEQNTILTDKRDSSVWFATTDMLYQWDIKTWLSLPIYQVKPNLVLSTGDTVQVLKEDSIINLAPTKNSLQFSIRFQGRDNMPRYMSLAFLKKGDSLVFAAPNLQTTYSFTNLAPGSYELYIQICQSDGTVTLHKYAVTIEKFLWQHWWFWALISTTIICILVYFINLKKRNQLAEAKAKTKEAELNAYKNEQEKKLANLKLIMLSSQFRPHFILNALNTIGAQMDEKPDAESVLSRLGESVNLIFNHAQQQKITHSFYNEWKLVTNVMHIHRLMYLKNLETVLPPEENFEKINKIEVPMGILQIPVENALLHGLSNRDNGPWQLAIEITEDENNFFVAVIDNGVGRVKSATLSNYTKHGTGTKNLLEILSIINADNKNKIVVSFEDGIFLERGIPYGTRVILTIPKNFGFGEK